MKTIHSIQIKDILPSTIEEIEKTSIIKALQKTGWVQTKAAKILGITQCEIGYKIKKYNILKVDRV